VLLDEWEHNSLTDSRKTLTLPIALSRLPKSLDFLIEVVAKQPEPIAAAAIEALRIYRHDESTCARFSRRSTFGNRRRSMRCLPSFSMRKIVLPMIALCCLSCAAPPRPPRPNVAQVRSNTLQSLHVRLTINPPTAR